MPTARTWRGASDRLHPLGELVLCDFSAGMAAQARINLASPIAAARFQGRGARLII